MPTPTKYAYNVVADFPGGPSSGGAVGARLHRELAASSLSSKFTHVNRENDVVDIWFSDALTSGEKTTLDGDVAGPAGGLIAAHNKAVPSDLDEYEEKKTEASTTSTTWANRINRTTAVLDGTYEIVFSAEVKGSSTTEALRARLRDTTSNDTLAEIEKHPANANDYVVFAGALEYVFTGVAINFKLQYYQEGVGPTAYIRNARLLIRRKR
jgi:hypothetical protein